MSKRVYKKDDILYCDNKPIFKYLDIIGINKKDIVSILDGNIMAKYNGRLVHGILKESPNDDIFNVQLVKFL